MFGRTIIPVELSLREKIRRIVVNKFNDIIRSQSFYKIIHRDYGELSGQLAFWNPDTGDMELLLDGGDYLPLNIKYVEGIHERK